MRSNSPFLYKCPNFSPKLRGWYILLFKPWHGDISICHGTSSARKIYRPVWNLLSINAFSSSWPYPFFHNYIFQTALISLKNMSNRNTKNDLCQRFSTNKARDFDKPYMYRNCIGYGLGGLEVTGVIFCNIQHWLEIL